MYTVPSTVKVIIVIQNPGITVEIHAIESVNLTYSYVNIGQSDQSEFESRISMVQVGNGDTV